MNNILTWDIIRLAQRCSMIITVCCCIYVLLFLIFKGKDAPMSDKSKIASAMGADLVPPAPVFDVRPYDASTDVEIRDIFSTSQENASNPVEKTPAGQLPAHLKIVGIVIAQPSQIIIEDSWGNKTYFIDEDKTVAGIKIVKVSGDRMVINYNGQEITIPVQKD